MLDRLVPNFRPLRIELETLAPAGFVLAYSVYHFTPEAYCTTYPDAWREIYTCRVALKSGTWRVGQRVLPLNVTFMRQLVGVFPCFAVRSGQLQQQDGALFQTHEARQLLRTHRGQC